MRTLFAAALLVVATPVLADTTDGTVSSFDKETMTLVMEDNTVWQLGDKTVLPETLEPGDKVLIDFTSDGDNGVTAVNAVSVETEEGA